MRSLADELYVVGGEDRISCEVRANATHNFMCLARHVLASKRVVSDHRLTKSAWEWLLTEIRTTFHKAMVEPGEMVGTLAAQSIGEPTTQMCLNSEFSCVYCSSGLALTCELSVQPSTSRVSA